MGNLRTSLLNFLRQQSVFRGNFTLSSGRKSSYYIDAKLTTLDPRGGYLVGEIFWELIKKYRDKNQIDIHAVGGLTMGADPIALAVGLSSYIQDRNDFLQTFSVRKAAKVHGQMRLIEGKLERGHNVVIVDDVVTGGNSTLKAIDAVESTGCKVVLVLILVDRQEGGSEKIKSKGYPLETLFTKGELVDENAKQRATTYTAVRGYSH